MIYKKAMVTGGAGFIGSELVRQLIGKGIYVIVVDNLVNGKRSNLEGLPQEKFDLKELDIREYKKIRQILEGVDIIFHLAALGVRHSIHSPFENHEVNAEATLRLLMSARDAGTPRFVHVSTSEVYGTGYKVPMDEDHPTYPMTVYGASKLAGECYARAFYRTYGYPTVVIRPFNTYGPRSHYEGDSGEVIPKMILRAMAGKPLIIFGDGEQTRDFTYVSDTASGIIMTGINDAAVGETVNIGSGKEITINQLAEKIKDVVNSQGVEISHIEQRPGDTLRLYADISKAENLTGFVPEVGLDEGLARLAKWFRNREESPEEMLKREYAKNWLKVKD